MSDERHATLVIGVDDSEAAVASIKAALTATEERRGLTPKQGAASRHSMVAGYSEVSWATLRSMAGRRSQSQDSSITSGLLHFVHEVDRSSMRR